ncbi:MAG: Adenylosuccinate lyase, partial [Thermococcales archaeon 44_46]
MAIHPIDYRYGSEEMKRIWEEENKLQKLLDVEAALARAHAKVGNIPEESARAISE